jgi:hypothetical protein
MIEKKVLICILSYNNYLDTRECINSLLNLKGNNYKILLIDNGSTDDSIKKIEFEFSNINIIKLSKNYGVPTGFNFGVYYAYKNGYDFIFILNNDTVVEPDSLKELMEVRNIDSSFGLAMPQIIDYSKKNNSNIQRKDIWSDGGYFRYFPPAIILKDNRPGINFKVPRKIEYAPACGILLPLETFKLIGLFDIGYFFFFEDWDFSIRIKKAGLNIWCIPNAKLWHKISKSTAKNKELYWKIFGESAAKFYRRHFSPFSAFLQICYFLLREFFIKGNIKFCKTFLKGVKAGLEYELESYPEFDDFKRVYEQEVCEI